MDTLEYLLKLSSFVFIATLCLFYSGKKIVNWAARISARRLLLGQESRNQWRLWVFSLVSAGVTFYVSNLVFVTFAPHPPRIVSLQSPIWAGFLSWINQKLHCVSLLLVRASGPAAAAVALAGIMGAVKRRRILLEKGEVSAMPPEPSGPGRNIVICCDGTGNRPNQIEDGLPATTNVDKIYRFLVKDEKQVAWYDAGVGSGTSATAKRTGRIGKIADTMGNTPLSRVAYLLGVLRRLFEAATGTGVTENIVEAYTVLSRLYRPGDRIYLFGFSRGAWTVRCLAGMIHRCGVLKPANSRFAADVVYLYRKRQSPDEPIYIRPEMTDTTARVSVLGVFDTVAALGVPLWGWWFNLRTLWKNLPWTTTPVPVCDWIYHAVSMDERRSQFFVTLFDERSTPPDRPRIEQVWFRGGHGDIGGGYSDTGLSDVTLSWMIGNGFKHGLVFDSDAVGTLHPNPLGRIHSELERRPGWRLLGSWPRWCPVMKKSDNRSRGFGTLHPSVHERADALKREIGRDELVFLDKRRPMMEIDVRADQEWNRTGIVLRKGCSYKITYIGGQWRDKECDECGPRGQMALDWVRTILGWTRRVKDLDDTSIGRRFSSWMGWEVDKDARWMTLIATVAHPRNWPLHEYGLWTLATFLMLRDPYELMDQLAPVGRDLLNPGNSVHLYMNAPDGMLWLFANDAWTTAANNSGAVRLRIELVLGLRYQRPEWVISGAGASPIRWTRRGRGSRRV